MKRGTPGRLPLGLLVAFTAAVHSRVAAYYPSLLTRCSSVALSLVLKGIFPGKGISMLYNGLNHTSLMRN